MFKNRDLKSCYIVGLVLCLSITQSAFADTQYKIKVTDNLSRIANKFYKNSELTQQQIFVGILAENPDAFAFGNINYLKGGVLLNLPDSNELLAMESKDAAKLVQEHNNTAKKAKKIILPPPFKAYSPKEKSLKVNSTDGLAEKQQEKSQEIIKLNMEAQELQRRLKQLEEDKRAMDAELRQLDSLIEQ